jgi:excisionase family DNA binding protein
VKYHLVQSRDDAGKSKSTMLTTSEVARIFNVQPGTVRRWCSQDKIKSRITGGKRLFKREAVAVAYLERSIRDYLRVVQGHY